MLDITDYALEIPLSVIVLALIANITLLLRIHFGEVVINKLSVRPY